MKLYRHGECEIRIRLTKEDLASYSITAEDLDYDSARGKRVIWELFDKARRETGFEAKGEKLYIQFYPTERGGCELFVTKLEKAKSLVCVLFPDFDTLHTALSVKPFPSDSKLFKDVRTHCFYALLPENKLPPEYFEFGEKITPPSRIFLKSRCRKVNREERPFHGTEQNRSAGAS